MTAASGHVHQISVSRGGVPKLAVPSARITAAGVEGDHQRDRRHHGGPDRAVCLFSFEVIERLRAEGHAITPGSSGENLTIAGLHWPSVTPGAQIQIATPEASSILLEITSYTRPCSTIRASFQDLKFNRIFQEEHPGESRMYARVLREGLIFEGAAVCLIGSSEPK
jgi:MOSC domain-containing protein YiiM